MSNVYRPWGLLDWVLRKTSTLTWSLFGCIGTEVRSLTVWDYLNVHNLHAEPCLLRIEDKPSRFSSTIAQLLKQRETEFVASNGNLSVIKDHLLLESYSAIVTETERYLTKCGHSVILDVTALPKRFFFPILRLLLSRDSVRNLIVTYTFPNKHTEGKLAENPMEWDHLPLFAGRYGHEKPTMMVIGVGFETLGLQGQIDQGDSGLPIKLFLPFPSQPISYRRELDMVRKLQRRRSANGFEVYRTDSKDISDPFERLVTLSNNGKHRMVLAPFGPKPLSVAMCIFAALSDSPVFYTQPSVYHPEYSVGVARINGLAETYAYCLRLEGRNYFSI